MKYQEKKYLVESFSLILELLNKKRAIKGEEVINTHYYTFQKSNDVVKLVEFADKNEIHILKESQGKYTLTENIPVSNLGEGLKWLKNKGYKSVSVVKMAYTDYDYKGGIVGLYLINDFLYSVILDFPDGMHEIMEKEFGLDKSKVINIPYNKLPEKMDRLSTVPLG